MTIIYHGATPGGGGGTPIMKAHNDALSGGATWHWPLDNSPVEAVTGGAPYDLTGTLEWIPGKPGVDETGMLKTTGSTSMNTGSIGDAAELKDAITVACWAYRTGNIPANLDLCSSRIAGAGSANNTLWGLGMGTGEQVRGWWQDGGSDHVNLIGDVANTASALNTWEHWTLTRPTAGTSAKLYKNGLLVESETGLIKPDGGTATTSLVIGHNKAGAEFPGFLFSAIVFETEMNDAAVLALYESTSSTGTWA